MNILKGALVWPLRNFYFKGPSLWGFGGWENMLPEDICAHITKVSAIMWRYESMEHCLLLLENKFQAFSITIFTCIYAWTFLKFLQHLWFRYFILGPILKKLDVLENLSVSKIKHSIEKNEEECVEK